MSQPVMTAEVSALLSSLTDQRSHVVGILEGLPEEALRRPVLPSGWTCLGLVRHLTLDVERFWFRAVVAGEKVELEAGDAAWQVPRGLHVIAETACHAGHLDAVRELIDGRTWVTLTE